MIEWKKINDKEYQCGENKISILNDSILYIEAIGEQTDEQAAVLRAHYNEIFARFPGKIKQLINLNRSGKSSPASRKIYQELDDHERTDRVAIFGTHPVAKVIAAFVIGISGRKNVRFFSGKEEALKWLQEKQ